MKVLDQDILPLGMGCWPIGGPFYDGDRPLGFANADDAESIRTIHTALDCGVRLFDTAAVYGAGNAERLLGQALKGRSDALIVTKIGMGFDETTRRIAGDQSDRADVMPAIDRCLGRLQRDRIDILLLHLNALPVSRAEPIFDEMAEARRVGKIRAFGWSTDFPQSIGSMAGRDGFVAAEHAMNVFRDAPAMQDMVERHGLVALIRSPLAMGLLTGKYDQAARLADDDVRATNEERRDYFRDARANPAYLAKLAAIRDLLQTGGRTLAQGALCWLMSKSGRNIPIPGARTQTQMRDNAGAVRFGELPAAVMAEIETLICRQPERPAQPF